MPDGYSCEIIWAGLGLIPFCIAPHYRSDHPESALIDKSVEYFIRQEDSIRGAYVDAHGRPPDVILRVSPRQSKPLACLLAKEQTGKRKLIIIIIMIIEMRDL